MSPPAKRRTGRSSARHQQNHLAHPWPLPGSPRDVIKPLVPWSELKPGVSPSCLCSSASAASPGGGADQLRDHRGGSSCNSGIFSTGRMLTPWFARPRKAFGKVNRHHLPANAITFSAALMSIGVVLNYVVPRRSSSGSRASPSSAPYGPGRSSSPTWATARPWPPAERVGFLQGPYMNWVVVAFMVAVGCSQPSTLVRGLPFMWPRPGSPCHRLPPEHTRQASGNARCMTPTSHSRGPPTHQRAGTPATSLIRTLARTTPPSRQALLSIDLDALCDNGAASTVMPGWPRAQSAPPW